MKAQTACFTGHRFISYSEEVRIRPRLQEIIRKLAQEGIIYFGCGGAIGFDIFAGMVVHEMKKELSQIKLIVVQPCENQDTKWNITQKAQYKSLLNHADKVKQLQREYDDACMHKRNRHLVDNSSVCVAYLTRESGGTAYTVKYARSAGLRIINIAEK